MSTSLATAFILRAFLRVRPGKIEGWGGEGRGEIELFMHMWKCDICATPIKYLKIVIVYVCGWGEGGSGTLLKKNNKNIMKIGAPKTQT